MDNTLLGLVVVIASVILARNINRRAMSLLNPLQQVQFQGSFQKRRWLNLVVMIVQIVGYLLALQYLDWPKPTIMTCFFSSIFIWIGIQSHLSYNELQKLDLPAKVIQLYLLSSFTRIAGIVAYVFLVMGR